MQKKQLAGRINTILTGDFSYLFSSTSAHQLRITVLGHMHRKGRKVLSGHFLYWTGVVTFGHFIIFRFSPALFSGLGVNH